MLYYLFKSGYNKNIVIWFIYLLLSTFLFFKFIKTLNNIRSSSISTVKEFGKLFIILLFFCLRGIEWPSNNTFIRNYVFVPSLSADLKPQINAIEDWRKVQLTNIGRSIGINGTLFSGYRSIYKIESIDGPDALFPIYYRELTELLGMPYGWYWRMEFTENNIEKYSNKLDFLNVKYIFSEKALTSYGEPVAESDGIKIYTRNTAWPRSFYTNCPIYIDSKKINEKVSNNLESSNELFLILEDSERSKYITNCNFNDIKVFNQLNLSSNRTKWQVIIDKPGFIYLSENYENQNFVLNVNGIEHPILRANHAFKAFYIEKPGEYTIDVIYKPKYFFELLNYSSIFATILSLLITFYIGFNYYVSRRFKK
jgi:hypothetical protein